MEEALRAGRALRVTWIGGWLMLAPALGIAGEPLALERGDLRTVPQAAEAQALGKLKLPPWANLPEAGQRAWHVLISRTNWPPETQLSLTDELADLPMGMRFRLVRQDASSGTYAAHLLRDRDHPSGPPVAWFRVERSSGELQFRWDSENAGGLREQLRNCLLGIADGLTSSGGLSLPLRGPVKVAPVELRMDLPLRERRGIYPLPIHHPPRRSALRLRVHAVDASGMAISMEGEPASFGEEIVVGFAEHPEAELHIRLNGYEEVLALSIAPAVRQPAGGELTLSPQRLAALKNATLFQIQFKRNESQELQSRLPALWLEHRRTSARVPRTSLETLEKLQRLRRLEYDIKNIHGRLRNNVRELPMLESRLESIPAWEELCEQLDGRARVHCDVGAVGTRGELPLAVVGEAREAE